MPLLLVMVGGFFGAVARYSFGEWIGTVGFPVATLLVNLAGCLFLGWFLTFSSRRAGRWHKVSLLAGTGFTGSFTTFSTFSVDLIELIRDGAVLQGVFYSVISIIGGLFLAYIGYRCAAFQTRLKGEG
ncbi:fluoride efflux transporter CrcB [Lentibacillus juripiscarius]|uniref:Fluoride-specific ion channel FluC n=1 Tax=Lentibacillus juripiscarius TaxID=257446 RepID=A0ABW5VAC9_9BACI